jgi:hypothetical protein
MKASIRALGAIALLAPLSAMAADEIDPANLYALSTDASTSRVKVGEKGKWVLAIQPKAGAHISDEAPFKIELSGAHLKVEREKLARQDSVGPASSPRFEVPFTADAAGKASVDAKLTFFICTEKICSRQQKTVSVPVDVN